MKKVFILSTCTPGKTSSSLKYFRKAASKLDIKLKIIFADQCHLEIYDKKLTVFENNIPLKGIKKILFRKAISSSSNVFQKSLIHQLKLIGVTVINDFDGTAITRDQFHTLQVLSINNIATPKSFLLGSTDQIDSVIKHLGKPPYITKILDSRQGRGVFIVESKRSLRSLASTIVGNKDFEPLLIQEYIPEAKGKDLRVFVIGDKIVAAMERRAVRRGEFRSNFKLGGTVNKIDLTEEEKEMALKATKICGLHISGIDIIRTKDGPKIIEVNSSPGMKGIMQATGVNIPAEILKYSVNE
ncbi:MAG: hypothetical protein CO137_01025 [Candidatus Magasanikbacteria bacterium CG_4_9_14_3_um_filter_32_9]|uniref:ATP-grasp domain-containing protein n=1 Tax=Candidatus Magasanikbacteria bacterium CG_4_9_14_3_um_filter_32_9 TaxID=1974644 RepID=A0A2M7Z7K0_9BACT|nr:MAG: hypothetical protein CO137_01025 [Candidatus Magasanikbacteria bacterium CG_4_9_14_3_um_filter_32_9]